jgi:hypothetical protein
MNGATTTITEVEIPSSNIDMYQTNQTWMDMSSNTITDQLYKTFDLNFSTFSPDQICQTFSTVETSVGSFRD